MTTVQREPCEADAGFTLMETLVALVIFVAAILAFERTVAAAWRGISAANLRAGAVALAIRKLEEAGTTTSLAESGASDGRSGGYGWSVSIEPVAVPPEPGLRAALVVIPYWVGVTVNWQNPATGAVDRVQYRLLKLGKPQ